MEKEINTKVSVTFQFEDDEIAAFQKTIGVVKEIADTITHWGGEYLDPDAVLDCGWDMISRDDLVKLSTQLTYLLDVVDGTEGAEIY